MRTDGVQYGIELDTLSYILHHIVGKFHHKTNACGMYSIYLLTSDLLSFINSKHEFSSIWKGISCSNDVMNHVDYVIKRDVYPQKMRSSSKNIRGITFVLKLSAVYQEK